MTARHCAGFEEDHAKISQRTVQVLLRRDDLRFWAVIVGAHHGRLKGERLPRLCDGGPAWEAERQRLAGLLTADFGPLPGEPPDFDAAPLWFNAGLIAVADWLASDERFFPPSKKLETDEIREQAERQLAQIGFRRMACEPGKTFADLFPELTQGPNDLQREMRDFVRAPGVYIVESSMGSGKTEAAIFAAYHLLATGQATGIYFALPTRTTSNRIHRRVADFVDRLAPGAGTRLIHGSSWLQDTNAPLTGKQEAKTEEGENPHDGRDWFASSRRALLAPFGVGTVDQALLGVVAAKHFFVRQFALAGKVVILDEVHSYDLYTGTLIDGLVKRLRELGATVIVLSATLTAARRQQLLGTAAPEGAADYPLLSAALDGGTRYRSVAPEARRSIQIRFRPGHDLPAECLARAEGGQCVLWIRNTVNDAQETYRLLKTENRQVGPDIALLHARFPQFRRDEMEKEWLERLGKDPARRPPNGCVLVSTQVAEQSVDIDADLLITDLAPTDMLLQRLGRLWRHRRPRPRDWTPEVWIVPPDLDLDALRTASAAEIKAAFGKSARVYAPYVLLRTLALWRERNELTLPADIRPLLEATYADMADEPAAWSELRREMEARKTELRNRAIANNNVWNLALDDREGVQTRWGGCPTASVLIVREVLSCDTRRGASLHLLNGERRNLRANEFDYAAAKAIHRNLVQVPRWCVREFTGDTPRWVRDYVREPLVVCELRGENLPIAHGGEDTGLRYRADLGVVIPPWHPGPPRGRMTAEEDDESYDW